MRGSFDAKRVQGKALCSPPYAINAKQIYACFPSAIRRSPDGLTTSGDLTNDTWIPISQLRLGRSSWTRFFLHRSLHGICCILYHDIYLNGVCDGDLYAYL